MPDGQRELRHEKTAARDERREAVFDADQLLRSFPTVRTAFGMARPGLAAPLV